MRLAAVVIIYNPDLNELADNLESYRQCVGQLIVWDNTPGGTPSLERLTEPNDVLVMGTGENLLIAKPLNKVLEWCACNGYTHLLTLDQDSRFANRLTNLVPIVEKLIDSNPRSAIFGVNPNHLVPADCEPFLYPDVITSGSVYDVQKILEINGFREDFGIDAVDIEICYRAKEQGYNTYIIPEIELQQQYGNLTKTRWGFHTLNYSAFRCYHITRNFVIMWKEYPRLFAQKDFFVHTFLIRGIPKIILGEQNKWKKLKAIILGFYDGLRKKTPQRSL